MKDKTEYSIETVPCNHCGGRGHILATYDRLPTQQNLCLKCDGRGFLYMYKLK